METEETGFGNSAYPFLSSNLDSEELMPEYNYYDPEFERTENYSRGMTAVGQDDLKNAIEILLKEPPNSNCYNLAIGNAGLAANRLGQFNEAARYCRVALGDIELNGCEHPPSHIQFIRNYGDALLGLGRIGEAIPTFCKSSK